jgi:SAM-dependent methyltransferase
MLPWYEDNRFWAMLENQLFDEERKKAAIEEVEHVLKLLQLESGSEILDLCCGPGRHSVELARRGFKVTGVDRTARYLEKAQLYAADQGVAVEFVQDDMRRFRRSAAFDGAINLFTSFGYFEDPEDDRMVLRNIRESLRPGARLVMEMTGKENVARIYTPKDWVENSDGSFFLAERHVMPGWTMMRNRWLMLRGGERAEFEFTHRIFSAAELEALLKQEGFAIEGIFGGLDASAYDIEAKRLVVVARK